MRVILIAVAVIAVVLLIASVLEKNAKPTTPEQMQKLSGWIMLAVFISIVAAILQHFLA